MSTIDERVVEMKFDHSQFKEGIKDTLGHLDNLNKKLKLQEGTKAFEGLKLATGHISFDQIASSVDALASKFGALRIAGVAALATIASRAVSAGERFASSFTLGPITDGFREYETKLGSIQTVLANTARYGTKLADVNKALGALNDYSDKTIYNFGAMTQAVGQFTNAGLSLKDSVGIIKGFSNAAAASGANATQAADASIQLSQALVAGTIRLQDWRSLSQRGIGNKNMQDGLLKVAIAMGTVKKGTETANLIQKNFNGSLEKGWLTAGVMSKYLNILAEDNETLNRKQLKAIGITGKQADAFIQQQKTAQEAATKIRTLTQLINTVKESIGSGWASTFENLFGNFNEATNLFTNINDVLGKMITNSANARNKVLEGWKKGGGRAAFIEGLGNAFTALMNVMKAVSRAFRQVFPRKTSDDLIKMSVAFRDFTEKLKIGGETAYNLKRTFAGIFSIFKIGFAILGGIIRLFTTMFSITGSGAGSILSVTAAIGDLLVKLQEWTVKSGAIKKFFDIIIAARKASLEPLILVISNVIEALSFFISGHPEQGINHLSAAFGNVRNYINDVTDRIQLFASYVGTATDAISNFLQASGAAGPLVKTFSTLSNLFEGLANKLEIDPKTGRNIASSIVDGLSKGLMDKIPSIIETSKKFVDSFVNAVKNFLGIHSPSTVFEQIGNYITEGLKNGLDFQDVVALIDTGFLILVFRSISGFFRSFKGLVNEAQKTVGQIGGTFKQLTSNLKTMQNEVRAKIILEIAIAVGILAASLLLLSTIDKDKLVSGLEAVGALMALLTTSMALMVKSLSATGPSSAKILALGAAMALLAGGLLIMATAIKVMSTMKPAEMWQGLEAIGAILTALTVMVKIINGTKGIFAAAAGMLILSAALVALSASVIIYSHMDWDTMGKGLLFITALLAGMGLAMRAFPQKGMVRAAASLVVMSFALSIIGGVLKVLGSMSVGDLLKSVITLAAVMTILVVAMVAAEGAIAGAQALVVVSAGLLLLAKGLEILGNMSLWEIIKSLLALVAALTVLGLASIILAPVIPLIIALGIGLGLLGAAMLAAGAGMLLFSTGLSVLATIGTAGFAVIAAGITGLLSLLPVFAQQLGLAILAFIKVFAEAGPKLVQMITKILLSILDAINKVIPKVIEVVGNFVMAMVLKVMQMTPILVRAGLNMIIQLLLAMRKRIGRIVDLVTDLIVNFLNALARNIPRIIEAGVNLVLSFLHGIADAIRNHTTDIEDAGLDIAEALVEGMAKGIAHLGPKVIKAATDLADHLPGFVKKVLGIKSPSKVFEKIGNQVNEGFAKGLRGNKQDVYDAFGDLKSQLSAAMKSTQQDVDEAEKRLKKLTSARHKDQDAIREATAELARARKEHAATSKAYSVLTKNLVDERNHLGRLANSYDQVTKKLEAAQEKLNDAKKTRDDYNASIRDQYNDLPDITHETHLNDFTKALQKKIDDTKKLATALQTLRSEGLNDTMYKELLAKGTDALPFINELVAGGPEAVNQINTLGSQLDAQAKALGNTASKSLYQAAVDSAAGLVAGLKSQQAAIQKQMNTIAAGMVTAIKKALGIKSPSREFAKIGAFSAQGLAKGLKDSSTTIDKASYSVGNRAIEMLKKSMSGLSDEVMTNIDADPTIRPVLDLTQIKKDSSKIGGMLGTKPLPLTMDTSYTRAQGAANAHHQNVIAQLANEKLLPSQQKNLTFNQYNNSPKALSSVEIYRQTKNQLSVAKEALKDA